MNKLVKREALAIAAMVVVLLTLVACLYFANPPAPRAQYFNESIMFSPMRPTTTVANLPVCNAATRGMMVAVTDGLLPTLLGAILGGGSVYTPVTCNGTIFVVG